MALSSSLHPMQLIGTGLSNVKSLLFSLPEGCAVCDIRCAKVRQGVESAVFLICHHPALANAKSAERQAKWLEKVLAYDHESDKSHADRIVPTRLKIADLHAP